MYTITIAGEREPALFRELLQSVIDNDLAGWKIFIQVEPSSVAPEYVQAAAELLDGLEYSLTVNPQPLGSHENSFRLLEYVFRQGSLLNIHLSDETLVAPDVTRLAKWYSEHHRPEWLCMSLLSTALPLGVLSDTCYPDILVLDKEFNATGFIVRRDEWYRHFQNGNKPERQSSERLDADFLGGWAWLIHKQLLQTDYLVSVQPVVTRVLTRSMNGGPRNRETSHSAFAELTFALRNRPAQRYRVVNTADLPEPIRAQLSAQEFAHKLLSIISHNEQVIKDQKRLVDRFRREANERESSLSFVLANLLVRSWCTIFPADSRRYRIWKEVIRPFARRLAFGKSSPVSRESPSSFAPTASRAVIFRGLPRLRSSKDTPLRILILKLDHIGDFLLSVGALALLREAWPDAHFTLVCGPWNAKLASQLAKFEEIFTCNFFLPRSGEGINTQIAEFRQLPLGEYDLAIDLRHDTETRPLLNHVRARYRAGFASNPQFPVPLDLAMPDVEMISPLEAPRNALHSEVRLVTLVAAIISTFGEHKGCNAQALMASRPAIRYFDHGPVVALAPGTGNSIKQWGAARFARVASALSKEAGCRFVLIGGDADKADAVLVAAALTPDQYVDAVGKLDISDVPLALAGVDLFIGNDTGTTHMAALMGIPTVNIFSGIADINIWRARGANVVTLYAPVECAPCRLGKLADCSYGHLCLTSISEDDVVTSALSLLQRSESGLQNPGNEIPQVAPREQIAGDPGAMRRVHVASLVTDEQ
jgi:ADP-heptose:LPS heptosyltransferase